MSAKNPTVQFTMREVDVTRRALAALKKRNDRKEERPALTGPEHASLNRIIRKLDKAWGLVALFALVCCSPDSKPHESPREPAVELVRAESAAKAPQSIAAQLEREREAEALNAAIGSTTVAANSAFHAARSTEQDARNIACAAETMAEMRAAEHWPLDAELARYLARVVIEAAAEHEIDPETLFGVGWRESRWMPAVGDGGRSCGMFQAGHRHINEDCRELLGDVEIAANAAARHIASIDHICHYNQGNVCDPAERSSRFMRDRDGDGEPDTYAGRVAVAAQRFNHCFMPEPMPALVYAARPEVVRVGSFSYARKRDRPLWERVPLGEFPAACAGEDCIPPQWSRAEVRRSTGP